MSFVDQNALWVLVVDSEGELDSIPLMSTDVTLSSERIIELYVQSSTLYNSVASSLRSSATELYKVEIKGVYTNECS